MASDKTFSYRPGMTLGLRLMTLGIIFAVCLMAGAAVVAAVGAGSREQLLLSASLQNLIVFALPAFLTATCITRSPGAFLETDRAPSWRWTGFILLIYAVAYPALDEVIAWNEGWRLPHSMSALEQVLRQTEDAARAATDLMLDTPSAGGLLVNLLIVGCLTGICEELFFRGTLQRMMVGGGMRPIVAVWIAAFVFSVLHFQFYGFVPRLLMGAFFGWLLMRTGSVWNCAVAHAINNSVVVVVSWLIHTGRLDVSFAEAGGLSDSFPWWVSALNAFLTVLLLSAVCRRGGKNGKVFK